MSRRGLALGLGAAAVLAVPIIALARNGGDAPSLAETGTAAAGGAGNPTSAVSPRDGTGFVAWVATKDGVSDVLVSRVDAEGAPAAPVRANDKPGDAAPHEQAPAQVAVGPEGNVYVLWQNNTKIAGRRFPASDLRFARSTDGGRTFEPAVTVNDDAGGLPSGHTFQDVVVGPDGTVWVSWLDSRVRDSARAALPKPSASSAGSASAASHGSAGSHGAAAAGGHAAHGAGMHGGHTMAMGGAGEENLPPSEVRVAKSTDGGRTFGPSMVVDTEPCPCCRTSMAVAADGTLYVSWRKEYGGDVRDVVVAKLAPGAAAFAAPVRVHGDEWVFPACPHAGPSLAVDGKGRVHVGWYTGVEGRQGLWYARSDDGGRTFGSPLALAEGVPPSRVELSVEDGAVLAAWDDAAREHQVAVARVTDSGTLVRAGTVPGRLPSLDASGSGALLAWSDREAVRFARITAR